MLTPLRKIKNITENLSSLTEDEKAEIAKALKDVEKEFEIVNFKLERTEKVKQTVTYLLEQTIGELEQKRKAIEEANAALEKSLNELKATQQQLIQSEKMASLGELTAGIAHEIQNPLNFVNNFAEVNTELVNELKQEVEFGNVDEVNTIANEIKGNNEKIAFHGKRADSIVKGMLQHSRTSTGKKEMTDINALTDEFLRLSYHGLRAKDKSFNAAMETNFDYSIDKIEIIPQDIGRVLLNLFNNAFYSVNEKKKELNGLYEPKIFVSTERKNDKLEIVVRDNGNGISQKLVDKIYQPFFTTKPTGEGTGLGLSLSYDIITKSHNGEIKVESKEGEYALFKIILPIKQ
jgi:signal transduction histidine kinase